MKQRWKQIGSLFLALCMVVTMLPGAVLATKGDEFTDGNELKYKVLTENAGDNTGTVALVGYEGSDLIGMLIVAETVYNGDVNYTITEIGENAFSWCDGLTAVVIGDNVETIAAGAFEFCDDMVNITLGDAVKTIGEGAFQYTNIVGINLPASVEVIGEDAFYSCEKLTGFTVDEGNLIFSEEDGVLLSKEKETLILYPAGKIEKSYTITDSVKTIGERAFAGNKDLTQIDTKNVVTIGKSAFNSSGLESINIRDYVKTIGEDAFYSCMDLVEIEFSANSSLENIGDGVFSYCDKLKSINLPTSLKTIGGWAFGCYELESISIGENVESIGTNAIYNVPALRNLAVDSDNEKYMTENNVLYNKDKTTLIRYAPGKDDITFTVPDMVAKIEGCAFYGADNLINVTVPDSVSTLGKEAFLHSDFKSITFLGNTPPSNIGDDIFNFCNYLTDIYVPSSSVGAYATALASVIKPETMTITALTTIDQAGWDALIANGGAAINDGDIIILGENVTGSLSRTSTLPNLTIYGNGHTINGILWFSKGINLTLKDIKIQGPDNLEAIRLVYGGKLTTLDTVTVKGGNGKGGLGYNGRAGVFSGADLTITASDKTTFTAGDANEEFKFSDSAIWVQDGNLTLDGGSPTLQGGKGYSSYGVLVGMDNPKELIICSGSPKFIGGSLNDIGFSGANVNGTIRISSTGSPQFIGTDGKGGDVRANGAWARNLEITAGSPTFKGGLVSEVDSYAGHGISLSDSATISGTAFPTFIGGDSTSQEFGGDGLTFTGGIAISTSGEVVFTGGSNCRHAIEETGGGSGMKTGINLEDLRGKITVDNTKGEYSAIGLVGGSSITYPDGLAEFRKYNSIDKMYVLDMGGTAPTITITKQPQDVTVTQGAISGTLTTEAIASNGKPVRYQWLRHVGGIGSDNTEILIGETSNTLVIPKDLIAGTYRFICSCTAEGCDIADSNAAIVTVKASGGGNGGNGDGGNGSGFSGFPDGSTATPITITPENKPNQPATASAAITATKGTGGTANAEITDRTITDAIAKAQADAKAQEKTANGISVGLNVTMPKGTTSLTTTLTRNSLNSLVSEGVTSLEINGAPVSLEFDLNALKEIQKQSRGDITISITPATGLSNGAKALIGNRPMYNIIISTVKDGKTINVTNLGNGTATLSIPYTPGKNEAVGYLFGVYVDDKGNATRIDGSAYDANARAILLSTNHFSVYGVGYTAPSAKFTDIGTHWGKEYIDYVIGRGLFSGTSKTTFAPDTAMTRGMLVTALGRLAEVDVKAYTTNSFTDVKADSTFRPYIEWAYSKGIVQGIGNQQFASERAITREEIAVIFTNYAKATGYKLPVTREASTYADASGIGSVYKAAVTAMQQAGIMTGGSGNKFNPKQSATRAEVGSMLHRYIKLIIDPATAQGWALNDAGQYLYYKDGKALTGTQVIDGVKYFFNTDGALKTGWVKDSANWRYYSGNKSTVGWLDISDKRYYFSKDGIMVSGKWFQIDGKWYYFNAGGSLAVNTKVDGFEVDENGLRKTK